MPCTPGHLFPSIASWEMYLCLGGWCLSPSLDCKGKKGKGRGRSRRKKQRKPEADILSPAAMLNLYYIAHNGADCLHLRGFPWPGAPKGKKGRKT
ncbi:small lysine-rich protein 1 isoform X1 [Castor canadensis]|uniref:Small lysine-rich protein 1 isoform X1 n=2 Tax=Castor canadensis TaxID=51338 RepID=A0AC58LQP0_CASCN